MKGFTISAILFFLLCFNLGATLSTQSAGTEPEQRGVRVLAKDSQTGQEKRVYLYKKIYAVIIGIDLYQNLSADQQLQYPVRDAKAIEKLLRERFVFDEIITLFNKDASREGIMSVLMGKLSKTGPDDAVLVFFAGHGYTGTTKFGELGFLIPYDGSFKQEELYKNISMNQLKEEVGKAIPAKHIFFMIDACYSGLLAMRGSTPETKRDLNYLQKITRESVRQVLTAGGQGETVLDGGPLGHSVFLGRIIEVLKDTTDFITASELSGKIKEKVFSDAQEMNHTQTPAFGTLFGLGDFVFIPRSDTRYEEVRAELTTLQSQLEEIEKQKKEAERLKSEKAIRDAKQKEADIQAQLKFKQLEQERLQQEQERKAQLEAEDKRLAQEEAQKKIDFENEKKMNEVELRKLRLKLEMENEDLKNLKHEIVSIEVAKKEISDLDNKINKVRILISEEKEKALNHLKETYNLLIEQQKNIPIPPKDPFEKSIDYENRIKAHEQKISEVEQKLNTEEKNLSDQYENEYQLMTKTYREQIEKLKNQRFQLEDLTIELLNYNPDNETFHVCVMNSKGERIFYSFFIKPDMAKGLSNRKELIKVEGYYKNLYDLRLGDVFIIDPLLGKYKLLSPIHPFSKYYNETITENDVLKMLKDKGLFDSNKNFQIDIIDNCELIKINGDNVILDFSTGLMWHPEGSPAYNSLKSYKKEAQKWLEQLDRDGYAGYKDWRVPNLEEAASLLRKNYFQSGLYINPLFSSKQCIIYTGDAKPPFINRWIVDFKIGIVKTSDVQESYFLRPVRYINGLDNAL